MSELADALWAPIFAEARATTTTTTPPAATMCWSKEARVVLPVAVPPPWTGTATIVASSGCTRATELRSKGVFWALWLEPDGATPASITVTTEVRRGEVVAARWAWSSDRASFTADGVGLSLGMSEGWVLLGDALRYAPEGRDLESTFDGFRLWTLTRMDPLPLARTDPPVKPVPSPDARAQTHEGRRRRLRRAAPAVIPA